MQQNITKAVALGAVGKYNAAELVLGLMQEYPEVQLICVLPHEEQAKKWMPELRDCYYIIFEKSSGNTVISTHYTEDCYRLSTMPAS